MLKNNRSQKNKIPDKTGFRTKQRNLNDSKPRFIETLKSKKKVLLFFGIYLSIIILYYVLITFINPSLVDFYINGSASITGWIMNLFGGNIVTTNNIISSSSASIVLSFGCEGSEPIVIFAAGVIAFPSGFKLKAIGILIGCVGLYLLNIIRIVLLLKILEGFPDSLDAFHSIIFPILFIFIAIILWGLWIRWANLKSKK